MSTLASGRALLLLAALLGAAAAVVAVIGLLVSARGAIVEPNVFVGSGGPIEANNSPAAVGNPASPDNVVVVSRVDRPRFSAALRWSMDGGRSWRTTPLPLPPGKDRPYAPDAAFAPDGTLYVTYVNLVGRGNTPGNLWIVRSRDGGRTLSPPSRVAGELSFQGQVAVDPRGVVHVTYLRAAGVGLLSLAPGSRIVATRSTDGGRNFSEPVALSDRRRLRVGAASPVFDANGDLVVLYQDFKDDVRDFSSEPGLPSPEPFALVITRSPDGGRTFARGVEIESNVVPNKRFLAFLPEFPSIAPGPDGSLAVAWADGRNGDQDVFLRRSPDGRTWSAPVRVNDNPSGDGTAQYLPQLAVAPDGRIDALFLDRRRDPRNVKTDAFLASSRNEGESFENVRVSSRSFDSRVGPSAASYLEPDLGSRLGLASFEDAALAVWTDTRLGSQASGRQDIVSTRVRLGGSRTALLVLAGVLLIGGALSLGLWRRRARA